jgi:hypothetical protein
VELYFVSAEGFLPYSVPAVEKVQSQGVYKDPYLVFPADAYIKNKILKQYMVFFLCAYNS